MPIPSALRRENNTLPFLKRVWMTIKNSRLFQAYKHSYLNPYHRKIPSIKHKTPEEALEIARQKGWAQYIYNGVRHSAEMRPQSGRNVNENINNEAEKYDGRILRGLGNVADRIPRGKDGRFDLFAEEPFVISIVPAEGPSLIGHACMQYKDKVVNRLLPTIFIDSLYDKYKDYTQYYFLYPSQLGINPKKLLREMDRHLIKHGNDKYNLLTNNCAKNVAQVLKNIGVKDIDFMGWDKAGLVFTNPGNNPFNNGLKAWCLKHGVHAFPEEMAVYNDRNPTPNKEKIKDKLKELEEIRSRYRRSIQRKKSKKFPLKLYKERD